MLYRSKVYLTVGGENIAPMQTFEAEAEAVSSALENGFIEEIIDVKEEKKVKEAVKEAVKEFEAESKTPHELFFEKFGKKVPSLKNKNIEWILSQINA